MNKSEITFASPHVYVAPDILSAMKELLDFSFTDRLVINTQGEDVEIIKAGKNIFHIHAHNNFYYKTKVWFAGSCMSSTRLQRFLKKWIKENQKKGGEKMPLVDFKFNLQQRVKTMFGDEGFISMQGFDAAGLRYYVDLKGGQGAWFNEAQLSPLDTSS